MSQFTPIEPFNSAKGFPTDGETGRLVTACNHQEVVKWFDNASWEAVTSGRELHTASARAPRRRVLNRGDSEVRAVREGVATFHWTRCPLDDGFTAVDDGPVCPRDGSFTERCGVRSGVQPGALLDAIFDGPAGGVPFRILLPRSVVVDLHP